MKTNQDLVVHLRKETGHCLKMAQKNARKVMALRKKVKSQRTINASTPMEYQSLFDALERYDRLHLEYTVEGVAYAKIQNWIKSTNAG